MYILRKKRIILIVCCLVFSFSFYFAKSNGTENRSYDITQVSAIPVTEKVIVIDAGHGGEDGRSCRSIPAFLKLILI